MVVRILAAMAANESATKSRRVKRKMEQNAAERAARWVRSGARLRAGSGDGGRVRAVVIRQLAKRFPAGESLLLLAPWLEDNEVRTMVGKPWRTPTLRTLLASGRITRLLEHNGVIVGPAVWPAIISEELHRHVPALMPQKVAPKVDEVSRQPPEPNYEALRHELSRLRAQKRLTYDQLAELTDLSRTVLINLEAGHTQGSLDTWHRSPMPSRAAEQPG
jgi:hypothetical protein